MLLLKGGKIKKLDNHYTRPNEVLEVLGKGNVEINCKAKPSIVYINWLKRSHVRVLK